MSKLQRHFVAKKRCQGIDAELLVSKCRFALTGLDKRLKKFLMITKPTRVPKENDVGVFLDVVEVRAGIAARRYGKVAAKLGLSKSDLAVKLGISPRTLATRANHQHLKPLETEKVLRAERILEEAEETFASIDEARNWMNSPQRGLMNQIPINLLDTDVGADHVRQFLSAIKYGNVW